MRLRTIVKTSVLSATCLIVLLGCGDSAPAGSEDALAEVDAHDEDTSSSDTTGLVDSGQPGPADTTDEGDVPADVSSDDTSIAIDVAPAGCETSPCFEGVACVDAPDTVAGYTCGPCPVGMDGDGASCTDTDGCAEAPCFEGVTCTDVSAPGEGYACGACPAGYSGDGASCVDTDGCASSPCFAGVICTDVAAPAEGFSCGPCPAGTGGDGIVCTDIDGCADAPCFDGVACTDVAAPDDGFLCGACPAGTEGDGVACTDIDGCSGDPCFDGVVCTDVAAPELGFACGPCPAGTSGDGVDCAEIDGCADAPCFAGVTCVDVAAPGEGFTCGACPAGTVGDGLACTDIDGCAGAPCFPGVSCADVAAPGTGFSCGSCPAGTQGDGITCADIDGCLGSPCYDGVTCTDVAAPGDGFTCGDCPAGYAGDGVTCSDLDGCAAHTCFSDDGCVDDPPPSTGFSCGPCPADHAGDGITCDPLPNVFAVGKLTASIAIGDVNNDGHADVVVSASASGSPSNMLATVLGSADGLVGPATVTPMSVDLFNLTLADFNGDGNLDAVGYADNKALLSLGDGQGGFGGLSTLYTWAFNVHARGPFAAGDFDDDGDVDLMMLDQGTEGFMTFRNDGTGNLVDDTDYFGMQSTVVDPRDMVVGEFVDGFPHQALMICAGLENSNAAGAIASVRDPFAVNASLTASGVAFDPQRVAAGDVDGDGLDNAVYTLSGSQFRVFIAGVGAQTISVADLVPTGNTWVRDVAVADVDADGRADIGLTLEFSNRVVVLRSPVGAGGIEYLSAVHVYDVPAGPNELRFGMLNDDAHMDMAVMSRLSGVVTALYGDGQGGFTATAP